MDYFDKPINYNEEWVNGKKIIVETFKKERSSQGKCFHHPLFS